MSDLEWGREQPSMDRRGPYLVQDMGRTDC